MRFSSDTSESLRVRDAPAYDRRDRDGDGADGLQVNDERRLSAHQRDPRGQRGDGCTSSSVSWMEWTQQLQASNFISHPSRLNKDHCVWRRS